MRLLLDSCMSGPVAVSLRQAGHEVEWAGDWPRDPGDEKILRRAFVEKRVLVTLDRDFGELAVVRGVLHHGILRISGVSVSHHAAACERALNKYGAELESGAIVTVEPGRVRIRLDE